MKIAKVSINNILGIKELEFSPGAFTEISAKNGKGKTSILEAIRAALHPHGHDATLLRRGETEGETVLVLDSGEQLRKRVTESRSTNEIRDADGKKKSKPSDVLKQLSDIMSVNPVDFLRAPKKDRVRVLLEAMPLNLDLAELEQVAGIPVPEVDGDVHPLALIDMVRKQVYDDRTGTNRAVKEKDVTINQLNMALPDPVAGVSGDEPAMREQVADLTEKKDAELKRIDTKLSGIKQENQGKIQAIRDDAQRRIDEIKAAAQAEIEAVRSAEQEIEGKANQQRELTLQRFNDTVAPINQQLAIIVNNRSAQAKREQALEVIEKLEGELDDLKADAQRQTEALKGIDEYKQRLLDGLPIPGVEVREGEIFRDGIVFDRLNTAQQVWIAVEIAKLRAGELKVVCVDGLELLDSAAFEEFRDRCIEAGMQLFVTRVSDDDDMVIETTDGE